MQCFDLVNGGRAEEITAMIRRIGIGIGRRDQQLEVQITFHSHMKQ